MIINFVTQFIKTSTNISLDSGHSTVVATFCEDIGLVPNYLHHNAITSVTKWLEVLAFVVVNSYELGNFPMNVTLNVTTATALLLHRDDNRPKLGRQEDVTCVVNGSV